jgi:hypothetical protein
MSLFYPGDRMAPFHQAADTTSLEDITMDWAIWFVGIILLFLVATSWVDTKARMARIERKLNGLLRHHGVDPTQGSPLSERVKQLANDPSRKIEAIKVYRDETGVGLAEAKEAVEAYIHGK